MKNVKSAKKLSVILGGLLVCMLSGCSRMRDIEDWDYVMTLGIDKGCYTFSCETNEGVKTERVSAATLKEAIQIYERTHPHAVQLGHVVSVILGRDYLEERKAQELTRYRENRKEMETPVEILTGQMVFSEEAKKILNELQEKTEIPINTTLYLTPSLACEVLEGSYEGRTLGEYLDGIQENEEKNKTRNDAKSGELKHYYGAACGGEKPLYVKIVLVKT